MKISELQAHVLLAALRGSLKFANDRGFEYDHETRTRVYNEIVNSCSAEPIEIGAFASAPADDRRDKQ